MIKFGDFLHSIFPKHTAEKAFELCCYSKMSNSSQYNLNFPFRQILKFEERKKYERFDNDNIFIKVRF